MQNGHLACSRPPWPESSQAEWCVGDWLCVCLPASWLGCWSVGCEQSRRPHHVNEHCQFNRNRPIVQTVTITKALEVVILSTIPHTLCFSLSLSLSLCLSLWLSLSLSLSHCLSLFLSIRWQSFYVFHYKMVALHRCQAAYALLSYFSNLRIGLACCDSQLTVLY